MLDAKKAGFTDAEIAAEVKESNQEVANAVEAGFSIEEILEDQAKQKEPAKAEDASPSMKRYAGAIAANIAISEAAKVTGTATGAAIGGALSAPTAGAASPITIPVGAGIGYVTSALSGGFAGSIAEQKILGEDISYGKAGVNALANVIPGGVGKLAGKGPKVVQKVVSAIAKKPITTTAAISGASGLAQVAGERFVETGELPSTEDMVKVGLVSSVLGAGLGKTSQYGSELLRKFASKDASEIDNLVRSGNAEAVNYIDLVSKDVDPDDFIKPDDAKKYITELVKTAQARVAPSTLIGPKATEETISAKNIAMAGRETGSVLNRKITNFISESDNPESTEDLIYEFLGGTTPKPAKELDAIAGDLNLFKDSVRSYQQELLDNHNRDQRRLTDIMLKKVEDSMNKGDYLTQEYKFFIDSSYEPTAKATADLKKLLVKDGMNQAEAEKYIADLNAKKLAKPEDVERFVYSQNAGILKERKDLSPELRTYLGEIEGAGNKIEGTMSKLSRLVAYDTADFNIKTILRDMGIAKVAGEGVDDVNFTPLVLRRGPASIQEGELFVSKPVQRAINSLYGMKGDDVTTDYAQNLIADAFQSAVALSKGVKVLANPPSYLVQPYGNLVNIFGQAMNPFKGSATGAKLGAGQFKSIAQRLKSEDISKMKEYKELGVLGEGISVSDMRAGTQGNIGRIIDKPLNFLGKIYSIADVTGRVSVLENNRSFLSDAFPEANLKPETAKKVKEYAAKMTNATYQNYDYLNQGLKTMSKYGVLGQFAAFSMELIRNQVNQGRLIKKMLDGSFEKELGIDLGPANSKVIATEGAKRLAALTSVYAATTAGLTLWNDRKSGFNERQQQALRESVVPEWDKNKPLAFKKGKDGKVFWTNTSYAVPHAQMIAPVIAGMKEESTGSAVSKAAETLFEDIGGEGNFVMNAMVPAIQNYNPKTGDPISKDPNKIQNTLERFEWFLDEAFTPGISRELDRALSKTNPQAMSQTLARQSGVRINNTTIEDRARFKINEIKRNLVSISKDYSFQKNKIQGADLESAYEQLNQVYKANAAELSKHVQNYKVLGMNDDQVIRLMRDNGIGADTALNIIDGQDFDLPKIKRDTITDQYAELTGNDQSKMKQIREISKKNPTLARSLIERHIQVVKDNRLNISERDKAVRSLGATDGTRADYIYRQMQKSENPDAVLRSYVKKRLANNQVVVQVKALMNQDKK